MTLRSTLIEKRQALTLDEQRQAAQSVFSQAIHLPFFKSSQRMGFYQAHRGEIDCQPLIQYALDHGKSVFLPVLAPQKSNLLIFVSYFKDDKLIRNRFGIEEPIPSEKNSISPEALDLVFMPLVAFDKQCYRLGMGQGYYDRSFAFKKEAPNSKPLLVGLAYPFQELPTINPQPWDIGMDHVIISGLK